MDTVQISNNPIVNDIVRYTDHKIDIAYSDAGTADERISTVTWSSKSADKGIKATLTYAGVSGAYYLTTIQYSKV